MARTTTTLVQELLGEDYDQVNTPSLTPFVDAAYAVVSRVATCASNKGMALSTDEKELIERWLAAHYYVQRDQTYASKSTNGASASFHGQTGMAFENSKYGQTALTLDYSGCLAAIGKRQFASVFWAGKTESEGQSYRERN